VAAEACVGAWKGVCDGAMEAGKGLGDVLGALCCKCYATKGNTLKNTEKESNSYVVFNKICWERGCG
jgi:hypothetical protein